MSPFKGITEYLREMLALLLLLLAALQSKGREGILKIDLN